MDFKTPISILNWSKHPYVTAVPKKLGYVTYLWAELMPIVLFSRPILKRCKKAFITLKVSRLIFILITKLESACLIHLANTIKVVCDSYGLSFSADCVTCTLDADTH